MFYSCFLCIQFKKIKKNLTKLNIIADFCKILCYNIFIILVKEKKDEKNFKGLSGN